MVRQDKKSLKGAKQVLKEEDDDIREILLLEELIKEK